MSKTCVLYIPKNAPEKFRFIAGNIVKEGIGKSNDSDFPDSGIREFGSVLEYSLRLNCDDEGESCFSDDFLDNLEAASVPFDYIEYVVPMMYADYENRRYFRPADKRKRSGNRHYGEHMVFPTAVAKFLASDDKDGLMAYMKEALEGQLPETTIEEAAGNYSCDNVSNAGTDDCGYDEVDAIMLPKAEDMP